MKIILFTLEYPPFNGGVANFYKGLVENWPKEDEIFVLDNSQDRLVRRNWPILKWLPAFFALKKEIKKTSAEHILVGNVLPLGTVAWVLSRGFGIGFKYSVFIHGTDLLYAQKSKRKRFLAKKILKKAEFVIANSDFTRNLVNDFFPNKKIIKIEPAIDIEDSKKGEDIDLINRYDLKNKKVIFSISRLIKRKGSDKVIEEMAEILKRFPEAVYFVAGVGEDEEFLQNSAKEKGLLGKSVFFLGKISDEEKWDWMRVCDVFVQPTREEDGNFDGFGIVYLEANLCGKPVVAGRSGGVEGAVLDGKTGILVNPENNKEIRNAILKILENKDLAKKMGEFGRERVLREFGSWGNRGEILRDWIVKNQKSKCKNQN